MGGVATSLEPSSEHKMAPVGPVSLRVEAAAETGPRAPGLCDAALRTVVCCHRPLSAAGCPRACAPALGAPWWARAEAAQLRKVAHWRALPLERSCLACTKANTHCFSGRAPAPLAPPSSSADPLSLQPTVAPHRILRPFAPSALLAASTHGGQRRRASDHAAGPRQAGARPSFAALLLAQAAVHP